MCVYIYTHTHIYTYTYVRVCALDTQGRYIHIPIYGSAPYIRRDDIWVWALCTQGRYVGLRPLYVGMIYGSGPFIPRDAGRRLCTYSGLCPDTQGFGQG